MQQSCLAAALALNLSISNSRVPCEKFAVTHLVTKITYLYGNRTLSRAAGPSPDIDQFRPQRRSSYI